MDTSLVLSPLAAEVANLGPTRRVRTLVAAWLAAFDSPHTQDAYARDLKRWLQFCHESGVDPLDAIRPHVDLWRTAGAGYATPTPVSVHRRLAAVSSWYGYLVDEAVLERSPTAHLTFPKVNRDFSSTRGLTKAEAQMLMSVAAELGPREAAIVTLLLLSGLRRAEIVTADVEDLGLDRGHRTLDVTRKGGGKQRIALSPKTSAAVDAYLAGRDTGPLITTSSGARITPAQVYRTVRRVARLAGIEQAEKVSPHSLRHAYATLSLDAGAPLRDVQETMGHKDPRTTMRYDRARGQLDRNPTYTLTSYLSD